MISVVIYGAIVSVLCLIALIDFVIQTRKETGAANKPDFDKPLTRGDCLGLIQPDQEAKADAGKPRMDLLSGMLYPTMSAAARVREFGVKKYKDPDNWSKVPDAKTRYKAALFRHITAWFDGAAADEESGLNPLWHALVDIMFIIALDWRENPWK